MIDFSNFNSLFAMANYFNNDDICKKVIIENRWGDDVVCPHCGKHQGITEKLVHGYVPYILT